MPDNFISGCIFGVFAAGFIGIILGQIREAKTRMGQRNRPLNSFPDSIQPELTPSIILWKSIKAAIACIFWIIILIALISFVASIIYPMINL